MSVVRDLRARPAVPADYAAYVRLRAELGVPEAPPEPAEWEQRCMRDTRFFEAGTELVAYGYFEVIEKLGYVRNVVVDPAFRKRGIGREVMRELAQHLAAAGCTELCLNVMRQNDAAIRLYESVGMQRAYPSASLRLPWARIDHLCDAEGDPAGPTSGPVAVLAVLAEHDARIERSFALPHGLLAARRRRDGTLLLGACDPREPDAFAAFASFEPEFGGAYPFVARSAAAARALLQRIRACAIDSDSVLLVVENDPLLEQMLLRAGAESVLTLWHYRAPL